MTVAVGESVFVPEPVAVTVIVADVDVDFDVEVVAEDVVVLDADDVADAVAVAVAVEVAVEVGVAELEVSSETSCVPISVSNKTTYWLFITLRTASTEAVFFIVHLIGRSAATMPLYTL